MINIGKYRILEDKELQVIKNQIEDLQKTVRYNCDRFELIKKYFDLIEDQGKLRKRIYIKSKVKR